MAEPENDMPKLPGEPEPKPEDLPVFKGFPEEANPADVSPDSDALFQRIMRESGSVAAGGFRLVKKGNARFASDEPKKMVASKDSNVDE